MGKENKCPVCGLTNIVYFYNDRWACTGCGNVYDPKTQEWQYKEPHNLAKPEASHAVLCAVPIVAGNSYGIRFLCSACDFPEDETLTMDMKHCWNCGVKLDWSKCEY